MDQPSEAATKTITVKVVDSEDKPLADVKIHVAMWAKPTGGNRDFHTDPEGKAVIDLPQELDILRLWATKPGYVGLFANWDRNMPPDGHLVPESYTFRLEKGSKVGGQVVNENGEPIEGARVNVMLQFDPQRELKRPSWTTWLAEGNETLVTSADGRWTLDNVPPGDVDLAIILTHPNYVSDYNWSRLKRSGISTSDLRKQDAKLVMRSGVAVKGTVKGPAGEPIANAVVVWSHRPYIIWGSQEVRADAAGKYELPPLLGDSENHVENPLPVTIIAAGFAPQQQSVDLREAASLDFALEPGKAVRIRFTDVDGNPIPEVNVGIDGWNGTEALYNHRHPNVLETDVPRRADKLGIYEWTWAPSEEVAYTFYKEGFSPVQRQKIAPIDGVVQVTLHRTPDGQ